MSTLTERWPCLQAFIFQSLDLVQNIIVNLFVLMSDTNLLLISANNLLPAVAAKSLQSCPTLCDPIDGSPPGSPVPGSLKARILEWVAISFSNAWKWKGKVKSFSRVQLFCNPMDCSLPGSSVHGIFQAKVLEWIAIAFSIKVPRIVKFIEPESTLVDAMGQRVGEREGERMRS